MPRHYHTAADVLRDLGMLARVATIDPASEVSIERAWVRIRLLIDAYKAAGDTRPLRIYMSHEPQTKVERKD